MFGLRVRGVLTRCTIGGVDGDGGAMGAALAAACARVEQPAATGDQTEGLQAFDRALLAQAGMSVQSQSSSIAVSSLAHTGLLSTVASM